MTMDPAGQYASPYLAMGNNPIRYFDERGDSIDISLMSTGEITQYNKFLDSANENVFFRTYYNHLLESNTNYIVRFGNEPRGNGMFDPNTNEVILRSGELNNYVTTQELFHAFQNDIGLLGPEYHVSNETEGDLISHLIAWI